MHFFLRDVRYALRQLGKSPGFALTAIFTLALGIGVNTAIFSVVNGMLFSSLHVQDEGRLLVLASRQKGAAWQANFSLPEYHDLRDQTGTIFSEVAAEQYGMDGISSQGGEPGRVLTKYVSGNYFQMLGVQPQLGRFFQTSEGNNPGADPVMILSYLYWKKHFAGDPQIIGHAVSLNGHPVTIIGVTPRDFRGFQPVVDVQGYLPLAMIVTLEDTPFDQLNQRTSRGLNLYARLQSGARPQQAGAMLDVLAGRLSIDHPSSEKDTALRIFPLSIVRSGFDPQNVADVVSALFLGLSALILLLACVNVTNLLLVRASVREHEMVIRSALGAQRSRLIGQMLTESFLLALFGGAAGIGLGLWGSFLLSSVDLRIDLPLYFNFGFDWHVFVFSAAIALLAGVVVGVVPALRLSSGNLSQILREGGRGVTGGGNKFRDALVMVQIGSALMTLIIAGLFVRSLNQAAHVHLGFDPSHVLTLTMDTGEVGYSKPQSRDFYETLLEKLNALPGVVSATTALSVPMGEIYGGGAVSLIIPGYKSQSGQALPSAGYNIIGSQYFATMRIPLIEGRSFAEEDGERDPYVAVISQSMAKTIWPTQNPIGEQFKINSDPTHSIQVVGIAADARYRGITGPIAPYFYMPFLQHYANNPIESLEVRTTGDPAAIIPEIERTIRVMAPTLPMFEVKTLRQAIYSLSGLLPYQVAAVLASVLGLLGLLLAIVGVYGVLAFVVSRKTTEIGIRISLGAKRSDILVLVYQKALQIVGIGLVIGLGGTFAVTHVIHSFIIVSATDPATYLGVSAILVTIALLACYIPARRAMRIQPMQALKAA